MGLFRLSFINWRQHLTEIRYLNIVNIKINE